MHPRELLTDTLWHLAPSSALEGLTTEAAERRLPDAPHSIAEIVAHMTFWMRWFARRCEGHDEGMVAAAADGWPAVEPGSWPSWRDACTGELARLVAIGEGGGDARLTPSIQFPPLAHYTIADALVHVANHNAHHLGQVILLRQLMKQWPPPSGSWTW